jgi:hypothetical protein
MPQKGLTMSERSDLFADPAEEIRLLKARIEEVREEVKTATPDRRTELGWWMFGARKHLHRLAGIITARRLAEHRFIIHEMVDGRSWAVCSCRARFAGTMHENFTLEEFPDLPGHFDE